MGREPTPKPLGHFLDYGVPVIPTRADGPTVGSWKDRGNFLRDREALAAFWRRGYRRFQLHPADCGLLVFDIDRKSGKDGLAELRRVFLDAGKVLPEYLHDIDSFPALTRTPSDGFHLYFSYQGSRRYRSGEIAPGLEVVHYNHLVTAPGSEKDGKPYVFYGNLHETDTVPVVVLRFLTEWKDEEDIQKKRVYWPKADRRERDDLSVEDVVGIIDRQGEYSPEASRNRYLFEVAKFAARKGLPSGDVKTWAQGRLEASDFDLREIDQTIQSAYRRVNA